MGLKVFMSYRRQDASGHAGRLYDSLASAFGEDDVFMDVDAIDIGVDFVERIDEFVASCDVLIAMIGEHWLDSTDRAGNRRLDNPDDFVRLEIATALRRNVRVIPVLVKRGSVPLAEDLPEELRGLTRRHAVELSDDRWRYDVGRLLNALRKIDAAQPEPLDDQVPTATQQQDQPAAAAETTAPPAASKPQVTQDSSPGDGDPGPAAPAQPLPKPAAGADTPQGAGGGAERPARPAPAGRSKPPPTSTPAGTPTRPDRSRTKSPRSGGVGAANGWARLANKLGVTEHALWAAAAYLGLALCLSFVGRGILNIAVPIVLWGGSVIVGAVVGRWWTVGLSAIWIPTVSISFAIYGVDTDQSAASIIWVAVIAAVLIAVGVGVRKIASRVRRKRQGQSQSG